MSVGSADSYLPGPPTEEESIEHVSRGEQKAQTASQKSPGTASACEGLFELGNCDRVHRNNGVEADKRFFSYAGDILYFAFCLINYRSVIIVVVMVTGFSTKIYSVYCTTVNVAD